MNISIAIGQASKILAVSQTLRNWNKQGLLKPDEITNRSRRYKLESLKNLNKTLHVTLTILKALLMLEYLVWSKRGFNKTNASFRTLLC